MVTLEKRYVREDDLDWSYVSYSHMDSEKSFVFDCEYKTWQAYFQGPGLVSRPATVEEVRRWFARWAPDPKKFARKN